MIPEQAGIFSLGRMNWLGFIIEKDSVWCAVRSAYLSITHVNFRLQKAKALKINRRNKKSS